MSEAVPRQKNDDSCPHCERGSKPWLNRVNGYWWHEGGVICSNPPAVPTEQSAPERIFVALDHPHLHWTDYFLKAALNTSAHLPL